MTELLPIAPAARPAVPSQPPRAPGVRMERVSRWFGGVPALDGVTLEVPEGAIVAIVGANGAGKSTLLATIAGLLRPSAGSVLVAGHPVERGGDSAPLVGYLGHRAMLYDRLTGRENLRLHARLRGVPVERIGAVIRQLDLEAVADRPAGACSHGTRRRLALAAAFLHDPAVLILDEPFAGLDPTSQRSLARALDRLRGSRTIVFTTHDLDRASSIADRVVRLEHGWIVPAAGTSATPALSHLADAGSITAWSEPHPRAAGLLRAAWETLRKDVTVERRSRAVSTSVLVLAMLLATVLGMAFEPLAGNPRAVSGILWVLLTLTSLHGLMRSYDDDLQDDALKGLLLTGADPAGIYLGRVGSATCYLIAIALASSVAVAVFFAAPALLVVLPQVMLVVSVAVVGLTALGGVLTVLAHHSRLRDTFLPLMFLPLAVPVLLAGIESVAILLEDGVVDGGWFLVLVAYAIGMLAASMVVFEHSVEG